MAQAVSWWTALHGLAARVWFEIVLGFGSLGWGYLSAWAIGTGHLGLGVAMLVAYAVAFLGVLVLGSTGTVGGP